MSNLELESFRLYFVEKIKNKVVPHFFQSGVAVWENLSAHQKLDNHKLFSVETETLSAKMLGHRYVRALLGSTHKHHNAVVKGFSEDRSSSSSSSDYYDVLVVGGGIMGSSTAHWLASRDRALRVGVIEPDPTYHTSATTLSVGGLRQQFSLWENIEIGKYARDFMRDYPRSIFGDLDISQSNVPEV